MERRSVFGDAAIRRYAGVGGLTASKPALRIREVPLPPPSSEAALGRFWRLVDTLPQGLEAEDGRRFKIIYPGRPGGASGPDFRDAVIAGESGERFTGDVELHLVAPDWYRHRHHEDPAYNGVVLHVVLHPAGSRISVQRSKGQVPIVSMGSALTDLQETPTNRPAQFPEFEDLGGALDLAGDRRFFSKASRLGLELERNEPSEVLYRALLEVIGYANNRRPFRHLAEAVPFSALASLRGEPGGTRLAALKATLLIASGFAPSMSDGYALELKGLAPYLPRTSRVPVKEWAVSGGRPGNHPMRRVVGAARLMDRFVEGGLLTGLDGAVAEGRAVVLLRLLTAAPHIGDGRAREIAVNAALPFLYA